MIGQCDVIHHSDASEILVVHSSVAKLHNETHLAIIFAALVCIRDHRAFTVSCISALLTKMLLVPTAYRAYLRSYHIEFGALRTPNCSGRVVSPNALRARTLKRVPPATV